MTHSIIIGGTKGLGRVVARQFAERGDRVTIIGRSGASPADLISDAVQCFQCDVTDATALKQTLDNIIATRGEVNYCVFLQRYRGKDNDWEGEYHTSLTATKNIIEHLTPHFAKDGDKGMVMVSSVFSKHIGAGQLASYHVAKAALEQLMRYYAVTLGPQAIRANAITPFTFLKEESKSFYLNNHPLLEMYQDIIPLGRMATTEDSANAILFLCSPAASFLTGQNILIDGGLSLVWPETLARRITAL